MGTAWVCVELVLVMAKNGKKVVVAMSGGVDSSVAACLLAEQGYEVVGFFMRVGAKEPVVEEEACETDSPRHQGCCSAADAADARFVAGSLNIPFYAMNFKKDFDRIIDYFADEYARGRTPNPCVKCNDHLKFGKLVDYADSIDADYIATGHYARIVRDRSGAARLARGVDERKDQSYVLFGIDRGVVDRVLFPIGGMTKDQVRSEARRFGLNLADKPDSVDICFVPDRDYARVVRERRPDAFVPGDIVDGGGNVVGSHEGVAGFTIGQRRGTGVAMGEPVYVTELNTGTGVVTVGSKQDLLCAALEADEVNWLAEEPRGAIRAAAKIRYHHAAADATVTPLEEGRVHVRFDERQSAVTPGQAVVFYDGEVVLGGAWIQRALDE
jgi:tRNA-specific 2-thiouridylase